jgi:hypothetical protein
MSSTLPAKPPTDQIHASFVAGLYEHVVDKPTTFELARKPLDLVLRSPLPHRLRTYAYAATNPPGERSVGDYKAQLMVPGQRRGTRGAFEHLSGVPTILAGYAYDFDVWILWDCGLHENFAFSTNVQMKAQFVYQAAAEGMARQTKWLRPRARETILAAHSSVLTEAIRERLFLTAERLAGGEL